MFFISLSGQGQELLRINKDISRQLQLLVSAASRTDDVELKREISKIVQEINRQNKFILNMVNSEIEK